MALKVPSTVAVNDISGDSHVEESGLLEKYAWQKDRDVQGHYTADIIRKTRSGGAGYAWVEPTYTAVSGLTGLSVAVYDDFVRKYSRESGAVHQDSRRTLVFYNVEVVETDIILFEGDHYRIVDGSVSYDDRTGRCEVDVKLSNSEV